LAQAYNDYGTLFLRYGNYDSTAFFYKKSILIRKEINDVNGVASITSKLAVMSELKGNYAKALQYNFEVLSLFEKTNQFEKIVKVKNNIAVIYYQLNQFDLATKLNREAHKLAIEKDVASELFLIYHTYGNISLGKGKVDSAIYYMEKALPMADKAGDQTNKSIILNNLGAEYLRKNEIEIAEEYALKALAIREKFEDKKGMSSTLSILAQINLRKDDIKKAIEFNRTSLNISKKIGAKENIRNAYNTFAEIYRVLNDWKQVDFYQQKLLAISDSIRNESFSKQMAEMETKYQTEKKDTEINLLNKQNALEKEKVERQKIQLYATGLGIILLLGLSFVIYRSYREKKKSNGIITQKNEELEQINEEILSQRDEIEVQKNVIEDKHKEIQSSITYAKRIQTALFSTDEHWSRISEEYFILFRPKDVVSGDFFWAYSKDDLAIWVAADCTGHGVPGAFMSMLGIGFLNEIVAEGGEIQANLILDKLKSKIVTSLNQKGVENQQKDGMDIALCVLDKQNNKLQFAGAYNPLYIVRNGELIEYKGNKQPIGNIGLEKQPFKKENITVEKGDWLYTFSDGFSDQFGGSKNKKFGSKKLKELLVSIEENNAHTQKIMLNMTLKEWMDIGNEEQVDDICIVGVQIK